MMFHVNRMLLIGILLLCSLAIVGTKANQGLLSIPIQAGGSIQVQVGSPPQHFNLLLDIGSASTWLTSANSQALAAVNFTKFDENESSTCRLDGRRWSTQYAAGILLNGEIARDNFNLAGSTVKNQLFGLCQSARGFSLTNLNTSDGAIGFGSGLRPVVDARDPVQNMFRQRLIEQEMFSLHLLRDAPSVEGTLVLGGIDEQFYTGEITYAPIESRWSVFVDNVYTTGLAEQVVSTWREAVLDTTSNIIQAPKKHHDIFRRNSIARWDSDSNLYKFQSCSVVDQETDLLFRIRGRNFTVPGKHLVIKLARMKGRSIVEDCYSAVLEGDERWILGQPFLRNFYTIYDYANKRLGFAEKPEN